MAMRLMDTNLLIRFFTRDDPEKAERVRQLLERVEQNQEKVALSPIVVFETVFTLQRFYRRSRQDIRDALLPLLELPGIILPDIAFFTALDPVADSRSVRTSRRCRSG